MMEALRMRFFCLLVPVALLVAGVGVVRLAFFSPAEPPVPEHIKIACPDMSEQEIVFVITNTYRPARASFESADEFLDYVTADCEDLTCIACEVALVDEAFDGK
jgi:hypothetical protein